MTTEATEKWLRFLRDEKRDLPPGPWHTEPDRAEFEHVGLRCLVLRNRMLSWCGYAAVKRGHPLHGVRFCEPSKALVKLWEKRLGKPVPESPGMGLMLHMLSGRDEDDGIRPDVAFDVHGGVTFSHASDAFLGGRNLWWFGFDCGHCDDLSPAMIHPRFERIGIPGDLFADQTYRTMEFAMSETRKLAEQLASIGGN